MELRFHDSAIILKEEDVENGADDACRDSEEPCQAIQNGVVVVWQPEKDLYRMMSACVVKVTVSQGR